MQVVNLQRSSWSRLYYLNVGLWMLELGEVDHPKEYECHVRARLDELLPAKAQDIETLLDLENAFATGREKDASRACSASIWSPCSMPSGW